MKFKKVLAMLLVVTMCMGMFTACSSGGGETPATDNKGTETNAPNKETTGNEERPKLTMFMPAWNGDEMNTPIFKQIEELTGYDIEILYQPQDTSQFQQKLLMDIAADVSYDIVKVPLQYFPAIAAENVLTPLDDLMAEYGPNVLAATKNKENWNPLTVNGNIVAVPYYKDPSLVNQGMAVRKDILDKYGLSVPTTTQELEETLEKLKTLEPDMIGYAVPGMEGFHNLEGAFNLEHIWRQTEDGTSIEPRMITDDYKEYMTFLNRLYEKGLLDPEFAATDNTLKQEKIASGKAIFFSMYWWDWKALKSFEEANPDAEVVMVPMLEGPNGDKGMRVVGVGSAANCFVIPKTCKDPANAMKFLNIMTGLENAKYLRFGNEGEHWEYVDGVATPKSPKWDEERATAWWYNIGNENIPDEMLEMAIGGEAPIVKRVYKELQATYYIEPDAAPEPTVLMSVPATVSKNESSLNELVNTWSVGFIMGDRDLADFDKFVSAWKTDGGEESIKLMQEAYAEYTAK